VQALTSMPPAVTDDPLPFEERRRLDWIDRGGVVVLSAIAAVFLASIEPWRDLRSLAFAPLAFMPLVIVSAIALGPWGNVLKHNRVSVDRASFGPYLRIDPLHIGEIEVIDDHVLGTNLRLAAGSRKVAWFGTTVGWGDHAAVLVERRSPDLSRPYWLIGTRDPEALAAALREARQRARARAKDARAAPR
jgi:hypothetical protein